MGYHPQTAAVAVAVADVAVAVEAADVVAADPGLAVLARAG